MSQQEAEAFIKEVINDDSIREELDDRLGLESVDKSDIRDRMGDVVPDFASEHGYDFTTEEGFEALETIHGKIQSEKLSDDELEQVAGGESKTKNLRLSIGTIGLGCAAASIEDAVDNDKCMSQ